MGRLQNKTALITGGASGIGEGTVRRFREEGARCVIADIQRERGEALAAELGAAARFIRVDVTAEEEVAAAVDLAVSEFGRLDVMFNNAGVVGAIGSISKTPLASWRRTLEVLLTGAFLGVKHAARVMLPQRAGSIITTSSTAGVMGGLGPHAYTAAKHGVVGLTKSAASELAPHGIRVNAIAPGNIVTAMTAAVIAGDAGALQNTRAEIKATSPLGIAGEPRDIANAALYLAGDEARYLSGHTLVVDAAQTTGGQPAVFHNEAPATLLEAGRRE